LANFRASLSFSKTQWDLGRGVLPVHRERIEALRRQPGDKLGHEIELPPHVADDRRALRQYAGDQVRGEVALHQRGP
jgi:hypothetical protein